MRTILRGLLCLGATVAICLVVLLAVLLGRSLFMGSGPKAGAIKRVIIFAELGNKIFEVEKRDVHGLTLDTLYRPEVVAALAAGNYEVSMAVDDFSPAMAGPVRKLNRAGVKVWVWPLHPFEDGYWLATDNAGRFPALYDRFKKWTVDNGIRVHGVMLDMEPTYQAVHLLTESVKKGGTTGAIDYLLKSRNAGLHEKAVRVYADTVARIKKDGYEVSTFNIPYVMDDRLDGDASIREMFHVAYVPSDIDVYMLYRSYFKDSGLGKGAANVLSYVRSLKNGSAGIGSYMREYIDFNDFADDLRIAARYSPVVHIYNLESLVFRGWLGKINTVDLKAPVRTPWAKRLFITGYRLFFFLLDLFTGISALWAYGILVLVWLGLWRPWRRE